MGNPELFYEPYLPDADNSRDSINWNHQGQEDWLVVTAEVLALGQIRLYTIAPDHNGDRVTQPRRREVMLAFFEDLGTYGFFPVDKLPVGFHLQDFPQITLEQAQQMVDYTDQQRGQTLDGTLKTHTTKTYLGE